MKIAFLHYHLKTGGVTTVIKKQVEAIKDSCNTLVLSGELYSQDIKEFFSTFGCKSIHVPNIGYDTKKTKDISYKITAQNILDAISSVWPDGCDILHVHNPTIAKNKNFIKIINEVSKKVKVFLQIHDFAEDGRPHLYYKKQEYPQNCHYGVINFRDYKILLKAGLKEKGLHKIYNSVSALPETDIKHNVNEFALYPIRAIRRKNIGEAILLSKYFYKDIPLYITLPPNSADDIKSYNFWKKFTKDTNCNVLFDVGLKNDFFKLLFSSDFIITTSISEGFGFSFLEPQMANKLICGRKISDICKGFEQNEINLKHLYLNLHVPLDWIIKNDFYNIWETSVIESSRVYGFEIKKSQIKQAFTMISKNNLIDFGLLSETFQKQLIKRIIESKDNFNYLLKLNPYLKNIGKIKNKKKLIENNKKNIIKYYNLDKYKDNLLNIYKQVMTTDVNQKIDKKILLSEFFNLKNYSLLKWSRFCDEK